MLVLSPVFPQSMSGVPESAVPTNGFFMSVSTENDNFGASFFDENDDLRTFSFNAEVFPVKELGFVITYDGLTNRGSDAKQGRIDALAVTLGTRLLDERGEVHSLSLMSGLGFRAYGEFGGAEFQQSYHESRAIERPIDLPYDDYSATGLLAYLSGRWWIDSGFTPSHLIPVAPSGLFVLSFGGELLGTTLMEIQTTTDLMLSLMGQSSIIMTGLEYNFTRSEIESRTIETVNEFETGLWLKYGFHVGSLFSSYGFHLTNGITQGSAGIALGDMYRKDLPTEDEILIFEYGLSISSFVIVNQIRWQPKIFRRSPSVARNLFFVFDYRSGNGPEYRYPENVVLMDQYTFGASLNLFPIDNGFQFNPFVTGLIGFRNDVLCPQCNIRTHALERVAYPVVQGETGVRLTYGPETANVLYGLGIIVEGFSQLPTVQSDPGKFFGSQVAHGLGVSIRLVAVALN
jgi:hypothetical protein